MPRASAFTANLDASFSSEYLRGNVEVDFAFGVANGDITYAGSVEVSGQVYLTSLIGWVGGQFVRRHLQRRDLGFRGRL